MACCIPRADSEHCDPRTAETVGEFFEAKNSGSPDTFLDRFARSRMSYSDATLGRRTEGWEKYAETIRRIMPKWAGGRSYPLRVVGGPSSAIVLLTDTPELFGSEIRALAAVDLDADGRVTRWVDYWDSASFDRTAFDRFSTLESNWPGDFGTPTARPQSEIEKICHQLHTAILSGVDCSPLLAFDAVWEDMALKTALSGRRSISSMLARIGREMPYGTGTEIRHVLGGSLGGGYEWFTSGRDRPRAGITAVELDQEGRIARAAVTYDSHRLAAPRFRDLVLATVDARYMRGPPPAEV